MDLNSTEIYNTERVPELVNLFAKEIALVSDLPRKTRLEADIQAAIAEHRPFITKPPFSNQEIIVMAVICSGARLQRRVNVDDILDWIRATFEHYCLLTENEMKTSMLNSILQSYDVPISIKRGGGGIGCWIQDTFNVPADPGRIFLRDVLYPRQASAFPFMELPTELRLRIYEMVLSFPDIEIRIPSGPTPTDKLYFEQREYEDGWNYRDPEDRLLLKSRSLQTVLAILSVNKEIHDEAVPIFYQINHFRASGEQSLFRWTTCIALDRMKHIRHMSLAYGPYNSWKNRYMGSALSILRSRTNLWTFEIETADWEWFSVPTWDRPIQYANPACLPHMAELVNIVRTAKGFKMRGDCPRIEEYLREQKKQRSTFLALENKVMEHG